MGAAIADAVIGILGLVMLGVVGWAFRISSRVSVLEADKHSLKELMMIQFDDVKRRLYEMEKKIERKFENKETE